MTRIIDTYELPGSETARRFEGEWYGDIGVSFFLLVDEPNSLRGASPHEISEMAPEGWVIGASKQDGGVRYS